MVDASPQKTQTPPTIELDPFRAPDPSATPVVLSRESKRDWNERRRKRPLPDLPPSQHTPWRDARHLQITAREAQWRHSGWARQRLQVARVLHAINPAGREYYQFLNCGADAVLGYNSETKEWSLKSCTCKNRMCQPCKRRVAAIVQMNLQHQCIKRARAVGLKNLRAITLTLRHNSTPLKDQRRRLFKCFAAFRKRKKVKALFKGGSFVFEGKVSHRDKCWHPHLHIIAEGTYVDVRVLSEEWLKQTGDSMIVWVKQIPNIEDAVAHDTKYITKATDNSIFEDQVKLSEWIEAMRGVRMVGTFGSWRGIKLNQPLKGRGEFVSVTTLDMALREAARGNPRFRDVIAYLQGKTTEHAGTDPPISAIAEETFA